MIPSQLQPFANHLWQSTLFTAAAGLLTLALRKNSSQIRCYLWLAASIKFLIPFSLLAMAGSNFGRHRAPSSFALIVEQVSDPFATPIPLMPPTQPSSVRVIPRLLGALWAIGSLTLATSWWRRWLRVRAAVHAASPLLLPVEVPLHIKIVSSPAFIEPGVFGVFKPTMLLPMGIADHLTPEQLAAVLAHEACHVRRYDNLATAIHMLVEAVFWFHPLVWWLGARLMAERESSCDEEVLRLGNQPEVYAEGILKICELYLESPLQCVAGVTGANLKQRVEQIMKNRVALKLSFGRKLLLASAGVVAVAGPIAIETASPSLMRAQSQSPTDLPAFEVASVKPTDPSEGPGQMRVAGGGRLELSGVSVKMLLQQAYRMSGYRIYGGPSWLDSARYSIVAKAPGNPTLDEMRPMLQRLLADRFHLALHHEEKDLPVYRLVVAKNGPKFKESEVSGPPQSRMGMGRIADDKASLDTFASQLGQQLGRFVLNQTGLTGDFDLQMQWTPDPGQNIGGDDSPPPPGADGVSIFTALQEQLGLKLEAGKGPVDVIVVDHAEKPDAE
jgi:bla regulator protein BlaR1